MPRLTFGGGLNEQDDINVLADECISGKNFMLDAQARSFRPRQPFDLRGTAPNGEETRGIMQLQKNDDTITTLQQAGDTVYNVSSSFAYTALAPTVNASSRLRGSRWALDDVLVISDIDLLTTVKRWNGTTFEDLPHVMTGVTDLYSKYIVDFGNRLWHFNIKTDSTELPHVILISEFEEYLNYDNQTAARGGDPSTTLADGGQSFWLVSPDLKPINGVAIFYETLVISTEGGRLFKLVGTDAIDYRFEEYYPGSSAVGEEGIVNIGNDVMFARKGPAIDLLSSTDRFGDVSTDDASRWIPTSVAEMSDPIAVYDQGAQSVLFFYGESVLVFDKDIYLRGEFSPWTKWDSQMESPLSVSAAAAVDDPSSRQKTVYFGGPNGELYDVHGTSSGDAGMYPVNTIRKTRLITELDSRVNAFAGRVTYRREGEMTLNMGLEWGESYADTTASIKLKGPIISGGQFFYGSTEEPVYYGEATVYYGAAGVESNRVSTAGFSPAGRGDSFFITLSANTDVQFLINRIEV